MYARHTVREARSRVHAGSADPHGALGLTDEDLLAMFRLVLTARLLDEAALRQNRMGRTVRGAR